MQIGPITADFAPFLATDSLRLYRRAGTGDCLVLSLSGVGKDFSAWPPLEFVKYANASPQHHFLFASDRNRSWLNDEALAETLCAEVQGYAAAHGLARIVTLGNSMGGFMALALAPLLGPKRRLPSARSSRLTPRWCRKSGAGSSSAAGSRPFATAT